jgi:single-strand DNA-binding protein
MSKNNLSFQRLILKGNLTRDPIYKILGDGTKVCNFTLAVNRNNGQKADFIPCVAWNNAAVIISDNCSIGTSLMIEGEIRTTLIEDTEGRKKPEMQVEVLEKGIIQFLNKNNNTQDNSNKDS